VLPRDSINAWRCW